jgi:hypothetical protein
MIYNYALRKAFADLAEAMQTIGPLITMVKSENQVIFRPAALAEELGVSKATVERHVNKARQLGLIEPDSIEHGITQGFRVWRLCPFLAWQGTGDSLRTYLQTLPADHPWVDYKEPESA